MYSKNYLLLISVIIFCLWFYQIIYYYNENISISNIYCNNTDCRKKSLLYTFFMGLISVLYEILLDNRISTFLLMIMYIVLFGLIYTDTIYKIHYVYTFMAFISMILIMIYHNYLNNNWLLKLLLFIEIILLEKIILDIRGGKIFYNEIFYTLNYLIFYIYLHFIRKN